MTHAIKYEGAGFIILDRFLTTEKFNPVAKKALMIAVLRCELLNIKATYFAMIKANECP